MYCEKCGSEVIEGNRFCPNCGEEVPAAPVEGVEAVSAALLEKGTLSGRLRGGLVLCLLGLLTFFGVYIYNLIRDVMEPGIVINNVGRAALAGSMIFSFAALYLLAELLSRARTSRFRNSLPVAFLGLLIFFGALLYAMQKTYTEYGYPQTGDEWAGYIGICVFLLGALILLMEALIRKGTGRLMVGPAISFLGLLTFFGALLYDWLRNFREPGYLETGDQWAAYVGTLLFLLGGLVLVVSVLPQLVRQR